jgi:ribosomal-protein-alanine N-acetyltransferase
VTFLSRNVARIAALHAESFDAPWDETAFEALIGQTGVALIEEAGGFILIRTVADEAEVLTLAVRPSARRSGLGARRVEQGALQAKTRGATRLFLEVAEDNLAARGLYARAGFTQVGLRRGYYARPDGAAVDALVLSLNLPQRLP